MITNLVCSVVVSLVTNVTEVDNHQDQKLSLSSEYATMAVFQGTLYRPATEKTNVIRVLRVTTVGFRWNGKDWLCRDEEVVSETRKRFTLESEWKEK